MSDENSFHDLMARLRAGDEGAADLIFQQYARRLVGLARRRLTHDVQAKMDPEDVLQSVFRTFFVRHGAGEFEFADGRVAEFTFFLGTKTIFPLFGLPPRLEA